MSEPVLFNNYAIALLETAIDEKKVEEFRKEAKILRDIFKENKEYLEYLADYNILDSKKFASIDKNFKDFEPSIISFVKVIIKNKRGKYLFKIFKESVYRFNDYLHIEEGKIFSAKKLDKRSLNKIIKAVETHENAKVELEEIIDESLLGGFIISIKDNVYDASLVNKLDKMKASLLGGDKNGN